MQCDRESSTLDLMPPLPTAAALPPSPSLRARWDVMPALYSSRYATRASSLWMFVEKDLSRTCSTFEASMRCASDSTHLSGGVASASALASV